MGILSQIEFVTSLIVRYAEGFQGIGLLIDGDNIGKFQWIPNAVFDDTFKFDLSKGLYRDTEYNYNK